METRICSARVKINQRRRSRRRKTLSPLILAGLLLSLGLSGLLDRLLLERVLHTPSIIRLTDSALSAGTVTHSTGALSRGLLPTTFLAVFAWGTVTCVSRRHRRVCWSVPALLGSVLMGAGLFCLLHEGVFLAWNAAFHRTALLAGGPVLYRITAGLLLLLGGALTLQFASRTAGVRSPHSRDLREPQPEAA